MFKSMHQGSSKLHQVIYLHIFIDMFLQNDSSLLEYELYRFFKAFLLLYWRISF